MQLRILDPAFAPGDFFGAADFETLALFDGFDEAGGLEQGFMRAGVEPGGASAENVDAQCAFGEVAIVEIGDLEFAAGGGALLARVARGVAVVEIQSRHCVAGAGLRGFFFNGEDAALLIEFHHAIPFWIAHVVGEDGGAFAQCGCLAYYAFEIRSVEQIIAQDQTARSALQELLADDEGLRQSFRPGLLGVRELHAPLRSIPQQAAEQRQIVRRADDEHLPYARQHQRTQGIIDHRLVVNRQELFGYDERERVEACAGAACEDDAFHGVYTCRDVACNVSKCNVSKCNVVTCNVVTEIVIGIDFGTETA